MLQNYLACINPADKENLMVKGFLSSLKGATNKNFFSGWNSTIFEVEGEPNRSYLLFEKDSDEGIKKEYFARNPESFLIEIDELEIKVLFQEDSDGFVGKRASFTRGKFSPDEAIKLYYQDVQNIKYLFNEFKKSKPKEAELFFPKRSLLKGRKDKTNNLTTFISLETVLPKNNILDMSDSGVAWVYHK